MFRRVSLAAACCALALTSFASPAAEPTAEDQLRPLMVGLSAERLTLPGEEELGLLGANYLVEFAPDIWTGISIYGANTGDRGGFFTGGLSGAWMRRWNALQTEIGLYVGGGGGGAAPQGSGLMLRPHAEIAYRFGDYSLGLGVSRVSFPDGDIASTQAYLSLKWYDASFLGLPAAAPPRGASPAETVATEVSAYLSRYRMRGDNVTRGVRAGEPVDMTVPGFVYRRALDEGWYGLLASGGAAGGSYGGYAEVLGGLGWQAPVLGSERLRWRAEAQLGLAGGGDVDTAGGAIAKLHGGLSWALSPQFAIGVVGGLVESSGDFAATEARLELAWRGWDWLPGARGRADAFGASPQGLKLAGWEVAALYEHTPDVARTSGAERAYDMLSVKIARELDARWRVVGLAGSAVRGGAGGYSQGAVGLGWLSAPLAQSCAQLGAEALVGAAGGGGVASGGGAVWQAQLLARCRLGKQLSLQLEAGYIEAPEGELSSAKAGVALVYAFTRLEGRP